MSLDTELHIQSERAWRQDDACPVGPLEVFPVGKGFCSLDETFVCDECGHRYTDEELNHHWSGHLCNDCHFLTPGEQAAFAADEMGGF